MKHRTMLAAAAITAMLVTPGAVACSSSSHGAASSAASSLAADPTYQAQVQHLQAQLLANFQKDFKATHPITSMENAVRETFPGASVSDIVNHAVKTFKLADRKRGPEQDAWMHEVVTFALAQSTQGVGTGTPSIPGVTTPSSKSPTP
jgi:hypothetical protein